MFRLWAQQTPPKVARVPYIPNLKEKCMRKGFFEHPEYLTLLKALPSYPRPVVTFAYKTARRESHQGFPGGMEKGLQGGRDCG